MIFVSPSYAEGFGLPAAEAMANGAAVVVTDNGGSADFAHHEETALVVAPRDAQALADAILLLLDDAETRASIVSTGIEASRGMTWSQASERMLALLEAIVRDAN
jgi:glycosyltransferase involved in cell wall biosynthesis